MYSNSGADLSGLAIDTTPSVRPQFDNPAWDGQPTVRTVEFGIFTRVFVHAGHDFTVYRAPGSNRPVTRGPFRRAHIHHRRAAYVPRNGPGVNIKATNPTSKNVTRTSDGDPTVWITRTVSVTIFASKNVKNRIDGPR